MIILVLNCGSSSLKYQVLDMRSDNDYSLLAKGLVERIGEPMGIYNHQLPGKDKITVEKPVANHTVGISKVLELLTDKSLGVISSLEEIEAVGHRVAHGGSIFQAVLQLMMTQLRRLRSAANSLLFTIPPTCSVFVPCSPLCRKFPGGCVRYIIPSDYSRLCIHVRNPL